LSILKKKGFITSAGRVNVVKFYSLAQMLLHNKHDCVCLPSTLRQG
jgi:hypothetical protein